METRGAAGTAEGNDLAGLAAIVTGGASGIGAATARLLSRSGSRVLVADVDAAGVDRVSGQLRDEGGDVRGRRVDVTDGRAVDEMVADTIDAFEGVDVLVCAAGITGSRKASDTSDEDWQRLLGVNLTGPFACARAVLPEMAERGFGRIVMVASIAGLVGVRGDAAYCASKGGLVQLTRSIALDYASKGITANAVCPGVVATPMVQHHLDDPEASKRLLAHTPVRRAGTPEEIAELIGYLASPMSRFVTGQAIPIDGGWSVH